MQLNFAFSSKMALIHFFRLRPLWMKLHSISGKFISIRKIEPKKSATQFVFLFKCILTHVRLRALWIKLHSISWKSISLRKIQLKQDATQFRTLSLSLFKYTNPFLKSKCFKQHYFTNQIQSRKCIIWKHESWSTYFETIKKVQFRKINFSLDTIHISLMKPYWIFSHFPCIRRAMSSQIYMFGANGYEKGWVLVFKELCDEVWMSSRKVWGVCINNLDQSWHDMGGDFKRGRSEMRSAG